MKAMSEAAKGMSKAIEYMNEHGWCQGGSAQGPKVQACIMAALDMVGRPVKGNRNTPEEAALGVAIRSEFPAHYKCEGHVGIVTSFNDHPDTTRADVDKVMQRALVLLIQEGATSSFHASANGLATDSEEDHSSR